MSESIGQLLGEAAQRLTDRVFEEMWADPFWQARFGERGARHTKQDGTFHVQYLVQALAADDHRVFTTYARWLRDVLCSRGMCSRHLAENFTRLAAAIDAEGWPERGRAIAVLHAGAHTLNHTTGDAGAIDLARADVSRAIGSDSLLAEHVLSYLSDSLAFAQPTWLAGYATFAATLHGATTTRGVLDRIGHELGARLPQLTPVPAGYLAAAAGALG
ncbi:MAG TPA: hypothetical protein VGG28_00710 [Kofleriaceae bacterium]|jgi:uncharacterized membrane protein